MLTGPGIASLIPFRQLLFFVIIIIFTFLYTYSVPLSHIYLYLYLFIPNNVFLFANIIKTLLIGPILLRGASIFEVSIYIYIYIFFYPEKPWPPYDNR